MNAANKTRLANILTALVTIFALAQTFLTSPPFDPATIAVVTAILTYAVLAATTWKQYLSPEVSTTGAWFTFWTAVAATLTGLGDLFNVFHFTPHTAQLIKWAITSVVAIINVLSKQIFPSQFQKNNMAHLKVNTRI